MEISDCIWDEGFPLTVEELGDLEHSLSTSIDSPDLVPFQCSVAPLADEADNSDMTPQCMPVIDPNFVRESFIEGCVIDGVNDVINSGDDVLTDYLIGQESGDMFRSLHVLVCGSCHSVFHVIEEFKSHVNSCMQRPRSEESDVDYGGDDIKTVEQQLQQQLQQQHDSVSSLALVLWTSTVLRRVKENLVDISDHAEMCNRIQDKWATLNKRSKQVWEKAAEALHELSRVGDMVFPPPPPPPPPPAAAVVDARLQISGGGRGEGGQHTAGYQGQVVTEDAWDDPCDYVDEIELLPASPTTCKVVKTSLKQHIFISSERESSSKYMLKNKAEYENVCREKESENSLSAGGPAKNTCDRVNKTSEQHRDWRGRWSRPTNEDKDGSSSSLLSCLTCRFSTNNPWKMERHNFTSKHISNVNLMQVMEKNKNLENETDFEVIDEDESNNTGCDLGTEANTNEKSGKVQDRIEIENEFSKDSKSSSTDKDNLLLTHKSTVEMDTAGESQMKVEETLVTDPRLPHHPENNSGQVLVSNHGSKASESAKRKKKAEPAAETCQYKKRILAKRASALNASERVHNWVTILGSR